MPTVADLERLRALTERLRPIADVGQGELIRAQDWNTLVGAVSELARAVLAEDRQVTPAPHEHPDQVDVGWLEPKLRALIERGPLSDPATLARLGNLEQRVERVAQRIEEMNGNVSEVRDRITDVSSRDLIRESDITRVRRVVEGLDDSRESVREVRESLRSLQQDVSTAVTVGQRFIVDGQPVDVPALLGRIDALDQLRERLRAPDGTLFDARNFENRLTALTNTLITQDQLDEALATVRRDVTLSPEQLGAIEGNVRNGLSAQFNASFLGLRNEIRADTTARLNTVDERVAQAVADAQPNIVSAAVGALRPEISAAVRDANTQNQALLERRLAETGAALTADYSRRIGDVQIGIDAAVRGEFDRRLPQAVGSLGTRVDNLAALVEPMAARLDGVAAGVANAANRIEQVRVELLNNDSALQRTLLQEIDTRNSQLGASIDTRFSSLDAAVDRKISVAIADSRRSILDETRVVARDTVATEITAASNRLRGEFAAISRDSVAEVVRAEVRAQSPSRITVPVGNIGITPRP